MTDLKKQLREKDMKLTDIRLEALTSAHQLEQLKETMSKMKVTMDCNTVTSTTTRQKEFSSHERKSF